MCAWLCSKPWRWGGRHLAHLPTVNGPRSCVRDRGVKIFYITPLLGVITYNPSSPFRRPLIGVIYIIHYIYITPFITRLEAHLIPLQKNKNLLYEKMRFPYLSSQGCVYPHFGTSPTSIGLLPSSWCSTSPVLYSLGSTSVEPWRWHMAYHTNAPSLPFNMTFLRLLGEVCNHQLGSWKFPQFSGWTSKQMFEIYHQLSLT